MLNFDKNKAYATLNSLKEKTEKISNRAKSLKKKTKEIIAIAMVATVVGSFVLYDVATGVAHASGSVKGTPYVIKAGEVELAVVQSQTDAQAAVENVKLAYGKLNMETTAIVTPAITIEEKEYVTAEYVKVLDANSATKAIIEKNSGENPIFEVYVEQPTIKTEAIPYETKEIETDELEKGEREVEVEGKAGVKFLSVKETLVNGKAVKTEVYSSKIKEEPVTEVVMVGTKEEEEEKTVEETRNNSSSSQSSNSSYTATSQSYASSTPTYSSGAVAQGGPNTYVWGQCTWGVKSAAPWVGSYWGNAGNWANSARAAGFSVGTTPVPGAVAVWPGHVALVTGVSGGNIQVMEANYAGSPVMKIHRGYFNARGNGVFAYIYPPQ